MSHCECSLSPSLRHTVYTRNYGLHVPIVTRNFSSFLHNTLIIFHMQCDDSVYPSTPLISLPPLSPPQPLMVRDKSTNTLMTF